MHEGTRTSVRFPVLTGKYPSARVPSGNHIMKQTKIVATIGLASQDETMLTRLIERGMNVARLNFSHGTHEWHKEAIRSIRSAADRSGAHVGVLADLQGPRIRVIAQTDIALETGEDLIISDISRGNQDNTDKKTILLDCPAITANFSVGHEILIEDGLMKLEVTAVSQDGCVTARVIDGGIVKNHKGVNVPDTNVPLPSLTEKDISDLEFALKEGVDFVALSFVRDGHDVALLREKMRSLLGENGRTPQIVSKIERKEAVKNLESILEETDVIMVARGDLGIETKPSRVAILQKEIIAKSLRYVRPVIVATQMLDSMIRNPRPTRAEVSDVSNAVIDHADAVMLSGETASGEYPLEALTMMRDIVQDAEKSPYDNVTNLLEFSLESREIAIAKAAHAIAEDKNVTAILLYTHSGFTARVVSHFRTEKPIYAATDNAEAARTMSIIWGIRKSFVVSPSLKPYEAISSMIESLKSENRLRAGEQAVIILGTMPGVKTVRLAGLQEIE